MYEVLRGIRVVEVAAWTFVPAAGAICADWGAEVLKIEHPETGDPQRGLFTDSLGGSAPDVLTQQPNRGKKSVALDLAHPSGLEALYRLVSSADVFLTNFLAPARQRLLIDVGDIRAVNPNIVYARGTGQGIRGPEADKGGFDLASGWARSGTAYQLTPADADEPIRQPPAFFDLAGGAMLAAGIAGALLQRSRTGVAPLVDVSLFGVATWMLSPDILASAYGTLRTLPARFDVRNPGVNSYPTKDGRWLYLVLLQSDRYWDDLCARLGRPDMVDDERFADSTARAANSVACVEALSNAFRTRTLDEWRKVLVTFEGVWAPVQSPGEVRGDQQAIANEFFSTVHDGNREFDIVASPVQFNGEGVRDVGAAPELGQHTDDALIAAGYSMDELMEMKIAGAVL